MVNVSITIVSKNDDFKMPMSAFSMFGATSNEVNLSYVNECHNNKKPLT